MSVRQHDILASNRAEEREIRLPDHSDWLFVLTFCCLHSMYMYAHTASPARTITQNRVNGVEECSPHPGVRSVWHILNVNVLSMLF